jgi:hypothetical protein
MSFPGKENLIHFENLAKTQTQIFDDACDMGIDITPGADTWASSAKKDARENLLALMGIYAYTLDKTTGALVSSTTELFIPFEFDEGAYLGVILSVNFLKHKSREYLMIDIQSARLTHAQANANGKLFKSPPKRREAPKVWEPTYEAALETVRKIVNPEVNATEYGCSDDDESAYLAEQGRSNPNAWAEAAYDAKRFN